MKVKRKIQFDISYDTALKSVSEVREIEFDWETENRLGESDYQYSKRLMNKAFKALETEMNKIPYLKDYSINYWYWLPTPSFPFLDAPTQSPPFSSSTPYK